MLISVVVPVYNEEDSIYLFYEKVNLEINKYEFEVELIEIIE